jgi:2-amino-4-hydroxy-6-hydroxymethyldihydropteridine diphosphokinase
MSNAHRIYLSLGSNLGDRVANLRAAIDALALAGVRVTRESHIYETEPVDYVNQPWFLNCVIEAETDLAPSALLPALQAIEAHLGRKKEIPKGPRLIDLDILFYNGEIVTAPDLQIPHPRLHLRRFVLVPLAELAPKLTHPVRQTTIADLLAHLEDPSAIRRFNASA